MDFGISAGLEFRVGGEETRTEISDGQWAGDTSRGTGGDKGKVPIQDIQVRRDSFIFMHPHSLHLLPFLGRDLTDMLMNVLTILPRS